MSKIIKEDLLTHITGAVTIGLGIKFFGKRILAYILNKLIRKGGDMTNEVLLQTGLDLMINKPEMVYIKYKKFKHFYQITIDLKHYDNYYTFDKRKNPFKQINSEDFPIKMRIYDNDLVDVKGYYSSEQVEVDGIYDMFESYVGDLVAVEDKNIRDQDEYAQIYRLFEKHVKNRDYDYFLDYLKNENLNNLINDISTQTNISSDIIEKTIDKTINSKELMHGKDITKIVSKFYKNLINKNNGLKESVNKNKNMNKIIKKIDVIRLSENTMRQVGLLKEGEELNMEMYNEMDYMEEQALCEECGEADCDCTMDEADKPDFLDLDKDGDKKESMKKASKEKEEKDVVEESINRLSREASKHNIISENVKNDLERFNKIMNYKYH